MMLPVRASGQWYRRSRIFRLIRMTCTVMWRRGHKGVGTKVEDAEEASERVEECSRPSEVDGGRKRGLFLPAVVGDEGTEGEESCPEAALGGAVVEGRGESGEPEPTRAVCPGEPRALGGFRERHFHERVVA